MSDQNKLKPITWCSFGEGNCTHTVHGDAAAIKAVGEMVFELEALRLRPLQRLSRAIRKVVRRG